MYIDVHMPYAQIKHIYSNNTLFTEYEQVKLKKLGAKIVDTGILYLRNRCTPHPRNL